MDAAQQNSPFEQRSIARIIKAFDALNGCIPHRYTADVKEQLPDVETAGSLLWDLTADSDAVAVLLHCSLLPVIHGHIHTCSAVSAQDLLRNSNCCVGRVLELCFGMLANLYAWPEAVQQLVANTADLRKILEVFLTTDDPSALSEICRMLAAALVSPQATTAWLPILQAHAAVAHLLLVVQNTLHPQLLERSIALVAALLHASEQQATEDDEAQLLQHDGTIRQRLWDLGLAAALLTVLEPVATLPQIPALAEVEAEGTWEGEAHAADTEQDSADEVQQRLYRQAPVLEALIAVLQQLAMDPSDAADTVQHIPQLPQLLLGLLATCIAAVQHEVLELLLPVLVMFRDSIVPRLQQCEQPQLAAIKQSRSSGGAAGQVSSSNQQQQQHVPLQYLVYLAGVLSDCSQDSLDALDAGWFLCAAATRGLWLQQQEDDAAVIAAIEQQQGQGAQKVQYEADITASCRLLERVCRQLSLAHVPETAATYAEQCCSNILLAIASATQEGSAEQAVCSLEGMQEAVSSLQTAAGCIGTVAMSLQRKWESPDVSDDQHIAALQRFQQEAQTLQQLLQELPDGAGKPSSGTGTVA